ncbi:hypothetical protein [Stenoxybacter acetivorans]|uniref:hypothetical protein n=1 Tax=Stenoxybacter acetivorans TaxID=422441 RepID=UPI000560874F|nr:hypothetical protein [Stenoxybacter acetivorans]
MSSQTQPILNPLAIAERHFRAFAEAFLNEAVAARWIALFTSSTQSKWRKIRPWDLWEEDKRRSGAYFVELLVPVKAILHDPAFCPDPECDAVVIAVGHSRPSVVVQRFSLITPKDWPLEGIISLEPGKRAFVTNHDGDVIICTR